MKTIMTAVRSIGVRRGLANTIASGQCPVTGREGRPGTGTRLARWAAVLTLAIALTPSVASAQDDDTVTISGVFSMDGEFDLQYFPELYEVFYNGYEHTWTLTLHGTTHKHRLSGSSYGTEILATSFELEFFGPDADTLNQVVSDHLADDDVYCYLENTYDGNGGGTAIMQVGVGYPGSGNLYFFSGQDFFWGPGEGVDTLFPADADGYPIVEAEPFSIDPDLTELAAFELFSGIYIGMWSLAGPVTFEGSVGPAAPPPPPTLSIGDASVVEGDRGSSELRFTVTRSGTGEGTISVSWRTLDGTALAKSDYTAASGTLTLPPNVWTQTISIAVKGDRKREADETFTVALSNVSGGTLVDAVGVGTILNDDSGGGGRKGG